MVCNKLIFIESESSECIDWTLLGIDRLPLVGDLGDVPIDWVSRVLGGLNPPVRQSYHEGSLDLSIGILRFCLGKVGFAHIILDSVLVRVRLAMDMLGVGSVRREAEGTGEEAQY